MRLTPAAPLARVVFARAHIRHPKGAGIGQQRRVSGVAHMLHAEFAWRGAEPAAHTRMRGPARKH